MKLVSSLVTKIRKNELLLAVIISLVTYLFFYGNLLRPGFYFWDHDAKNYYIPARFYFYEKVTEEKTFPFWTERLYLGFPVFADIEMGYWHFLNLFLILIFGPLLSYKILHLLFYLIGSISLYLLLKKYQINLWGFFVANLIFYFNFFMNLHQIHYNVVLTFYLLPFSIYLIELYSEKRKFSLIFYQSLSLSSGFLLGHTQSFFIFLLGIVIFFLLKIKKEELIKQFLIYFSISALLVLIFSLPQIFPTFEAFQESMRKETLDYKQGSLFPVLTSLIFIPNPFSVLDNYQGYIFNKTYFEHETYIYIGISTFLILIVAYFSKGIAIFKKYSLITFYVFIFLATLGSNHFFQDNFLISLFRYWQRVIILFIFGASVLCGFFISNISTIQFKNVKRKFVLLLPIFLYLLILDVSESNLSINYLYFINLIKNLDSWFFGIIIASFLIIYGLITKNLNIDNGRIIKSIICLILILDLHHFSKPYIDKTLLHVEIKNSEEYKINYPNQRLLFQNSNLSGLEYLYLKSWSLMGFSNFLQEDYYFYLIQNKLIPSDSLVTKNIEVRDLNNLNKLGITKIINQNGEANLKYKNLDLFDENLKGEFIKKAEGDIKFKYYLENKAQINTKIRYSENWEIKVNNQKISYQPKDIFISFEAPSGENTVEIKYIPKSFYLGTVMSGFLTIILVFMVWKFKKVKYLS